MNHHDIERLFTYRKPDDEERARMDRINAAVLALGHALVLNAPPGVQLEQAVLQLQLVRMHANMAIIHGGGPLAAAPAAPAGTQP